MERNLYLMKFEEVVKGADKIARQIKNKGLKFDVIVPLLKGGLTFACLVGDRIGVSDYSCLHLKSAVNSGQNAELKEPINLGITNEQVLKDKKVLIVDDICDTGRSMILAKKVIKEFGAKEVFNVTLVNVNKNMLHEDDFMYALDFSNENYWIVFPWEMA